jgi:prepilin-type N-terminal cleavage/methylation domain-containing protein
MTMPLWARRLRGRCGDDGVSLLEVIVALTIIGMVMVSAAAFFINGLHNGNLQTQRQASVTLANQAVEAVQAVAPDKLLAGRTQTAVNALLATSGASALTVEDVVSTSAAIPETLNFDPGATTPGSETVKLTQTQTVDNVVYTVRNFIDVCWLDVAAGTCTRTKPSGAIAVYRATSWVTWTPGGGATCPGGCSFAASTLIDKQGDPRFNSNISSPIISAVSPTPVAVGSTKALTVTGVSFKAGAIATIGAGGGSLGAVTNNTGTSLNVTLTAGPTPGSYVFSIVNPDGGRANYSLTVSAGPTITSISPGSIANSAGTPVTITGTGFQNGAVITMTSGTVSSTSFVSSTSMTATLSPSGSTGTRVVTVTNPDGGVATSPVTVSASQPNITSGAQGSTAAVNAATTITLTGTNFDPAATVTASTGAVGSYTTRTSTSFVFAFTPSAANASTTFTLTNPDGGAGSRAITVATLPPPTITSGSQSTTSPVNTAISITLLGSNFSTTGTVTASAGGDMGSYSTRTPSQFTFTFTPRSANPVITFTLYAAGGSATHTRTVTTSAVTPPTISGGSQSGQTTANTVTLSGNGFSVGNAVVTSSGGTVGSYSTRSGTSIAFNYTVTTPGSTTFTVTNPDGGSASRVVIVNVKPTISGASSTTYKKNQSTTVTVNGSNFLSGATVKITMNGSTTTLSPSSLTATQITVPFTNPPNSGTYPSTIVVTNSDGTASDPYNVNYPVTN